MTNPPGAESRQHPDEQELARAMHASDALRQLLAAAAAPPSTAELKGRARAVAAFRAAYRLRRPAAGGPPIGSPEPAEEVQPAARAGADPRTEAAGNEDRAPAGARRRTRLARARRWSAAQLTVVGSTLLVLLGATAAAAAAGQLPAPLQQTVSDLFDGPENHGPARPGPVPPGSSVVRPSPVPDRTAAHPSAATRAPGMPASSRSADSPAQLAGLCRAYRAAASHAAPLSAPGFLPLVRAAGGTSQVDGFCAALPATGRAAPPTGRAALSATGRAAPPTGRAAPPATGRAAFPVTGRAAPPAVRSPKAGPPAATGRQGPHSGGPAASRTGLPPAHPRSAPRLPAARQAGEGSGHLHR